MVHYTKQKVFFNEINFKIKKQIGVFEMSRAIENNVSRLHAVADNFTLNVIRNSDVGIIFREKRNEPLHETAVTSLFFIFYFWNNHAIIFSE